MLKMTTQDELISLIFRASRLMRQNSARDHRHDFSFFQIRVLGFIDENIKPTMKDIADNFCVTCPSATSVIERLVELKNIRRIPDTRDRRIVRLALTGKGKTTLERGIKELSKHMEKMLSKLSAKEKSELKKILKKITLNL